MKEENLKSVSVQLDKLSWEGYMEISEISTELDRLKESGCTHIIFGYTENYGDVELDIQPIIKRLETEEEYQIRLVDEKWQQKNKDLADQMEYERLKQKFEK